MAKTKMESLPFVFNHIPFFFGPRFLSIKIPYFLFLVVICFLPLLLLHLGQTVVGRECIKRLLRGTLTPPIIRILSMLVLTKYAPTQNAFFHYLSLF